ncbi:hypothetical protein JHK87_028874 [Glycine soja]|nr:hypothetical protein JHK87_028874 [Glycine soja]
MESPECPVFLQSFDERDAIPRVLSCGHSVCEACLAELPQRYQDTIRCPACSQLISNQRSTTNSCYYHPPFSSHEFYVTWKDWILPHDAVLTDDHCIGWFSSTKGRGCFGVNRSVSLAPIVCFPPRDRSKFRFSYVAWVIKCLEGLNEGVKEELA